MSLSTTLPSRHMQEEEPQKLDLSPCTNTHLRLHLQVEDWIQLQSKANKPELNQNQKKNTKNASKSAIKIYMNIFPPTCFEYTVLFQAKCKIYYCMYKPLLQQHGEEHHKFSQILTTKQNHQQKTNAKHRCHLSFSLATMGSHLRKIAISENNWDFFKKEINIACL